MVWRGKPRSQIHVMMWNGNVKTPDGLPAMLESMFDRPYDTKVLKLAQMMPGMICGN